MSILGFNNDVSNPNPMIQISAIQDMLKMYSNNLSNGNLQSSLPNEINVYVDFSFKLSNGLKIIKEKINLPGNSLLNKRNHKESHIFSSNTNHYQKKSQSIYNAYKEDKQNIELFSRSNMHNNFFGLDELSEVLNKISNKIKIILVFDRNNYVSQIIPTMKEEIEQIVRNKLEELTDDFNSEVLYNQIEYLKHNMSIKIHQVLFNNSSIGMKVLLRHLSSKNTELNLEAVGVIHLPHVLPNEQIMHEPMVNKELLLSQIVHKKEEPKNIFNTPKAPSRKETKKKKHQKKIKQIQK